MAVSRTASAGAAKTPKRPARPSSRPVPRPAPPAEAVRIGDLSEFLGYSLKRAQLRIFDDFIRCVAPLQLTPAQFSVLMLVETNPGRNQTEIASTLGILRPNFVALLDELESRDLCLRSRSTNDRRSHILRLTDKGRAVLSRARKLIEARHEARLKELLGDTNRDQLLAMLGKIAREF
jgi:DNA-binding MarR family transcriptional regulator